jgi:DNA-binding transcriptional ArsR family regulator
VNNAEETRILLSLFSSRTRLKILQLFFAYESRSFFVREITRRINERINSVRRELENLTSIGFLTTYTEKNKTFYKINMDFFFYEDLRSMFLKIAPEKESYNYAFKISDIPGVEKVYLSGVFTDNPLSPTDVLIVGNVQTKKVKDLIKDIEKDVGSMVRYTVLTYNDFLLRESLHNKFLRDVLSVSECIYSKE